MSSEQRKAPVSGRGSERTFNEEEVLMSTVNGKSESRLSRNHWVLREQIMESIVTGSKVTALCGAQYVVSSQGEGACSSPSLPTCEWCEALHSLAEQLRAEDRTKSGVTTCP